MENHKIYTGSRSVQAKTIEEAFDELEMILNDDLENIMPEYNLVQVIPTEVPEEDNYVRHRYTFVVIYQLKES